MTSFSLTSIPLASLSVDPSESDELSTSSKGGGAVGGSVSHTVGAKSAGSGLVGVEGVTKVAGSYPRDGNAAIS